MRLLALVFAFLLHSTAAYSGAWMQGENKGYFKLNHSIMEAKSFYNKDGDVLSGFDQSFIQTSLYGEYGLTNKLDLIISLPFYSQHQIQDIDKSLSAIGDIDIEAKYPLKQDSKLNISLSLKMGLPSGTNKEVDNYLLQTGDGEFNQEIKLDIGKSFKYGLYANLAFGFNQRSENYSDETKLDGEVGIAIQDKFYLAIKSRWLNSLQNGNREETPQFSVFSNNIEYISFGPELAYKSKKGVGIHLSYFTATRVKNIMATPQLNFGLFYDF